MYRIGIDLGGTNIAAGLVDDEYRIVRRASVKTNAPRDVDAIASDMAALTGELLDAEGIDFSRVASVGVGVPGTANEETGRLEDADNLGWRDVEFLPVLEKLLPVPVKFANDANCAAWGEYSAGGYSGSLVMVTIGTGIGGGIILDGRLWTGINYAAGEFGHITLRPDGEMCSCGRRGCFEAHCSATGLIRSAVRAMAREETTLRGLCGGDPGALEAKHVFDAASLGDAAAASILDGYIAELAEGIANIINILQPAVLCIGGGVSRAGDALLLPLREKTRELIYSKSARRNTEIVLAKLDNDAGIIGAALL